MTPELWTAEECAELHVTPADMARAWQAVMEWHRGGHLVGRIAVALREQREAAVLTAPMTVNLSANTANRAATPQRATGMLLMRYLKALYK